MSKINELESKPVGKLLLQYSMPAILGLFANSFYIVIDRIFIGNIPNIGAIALNAVGLTVPITTIILALSAMIAFGSAGNISIKLGQDKREEAENTLGNAFVLSIVVGITITALFFVFQNKVFAFIGIQGETLSYAKSYTTIIVLGTVFNMLGFALPILVRSYGNPTFSAIITLTGCALNIGLDVLFIPVLNMGIEGAAVATVLSQFVTVILGLAYFKTQKTTLHIEKRIFKVQPKLVKEIVSIGLSPFSNQLSITVAQFVSNYALRLYGGESAVGAMTIITSVASMFLMPVYGIAQGMQPIVGYNYAKKLYKRVIKTLAQAIILGLAILGTGTCLTLLFPASIVGLFNHNSELANITLVGLTKYMLLLPFAVIPTFGSGFMSLTNRAKTAVFINITRQAIILTLVICFLPRLIGTNGLWFAQSIADILSSLLVVLVFVKGYGHIFLKNENIKSE
ncbi:MATE family efflux transporter [Clostridium isatidis]|uniref:MATE family efflux transporter n=1 Tax=Clostridium isatidis TaxID=182773 RepID=UPI003AAFD2A0